MFQSAEHYLLQNFNSVANFLLKTSSPWITGLMSLNREAYMPPSHLSWVCFSAFLWSFLKSQSRTSCQSPLMSHSILSITIIFILHLLSTASTQFSVPLAPLLSSHPQFPSSMTTYGAMICHGPPLKTPKRRTSLSARDHPATEGLCEFFFSFFYSPCFCLHKLPCDECYMKGSAINLIL